MKSSKRREDAEQESIRIYLSQISCYPLLTPEEEIDLAKRVEAGDTAAKKRFIESNLRLAVFAAKKYPTKLVRFLDLVQGANCGLIRAVEKFDWRLGHRFSTFAVHWLKAGISKTIAEHGRTIRIPPHMQEQCREVMRLQRQLKQELGRDATVEELSDRTGLTPAKIRHRLEVAQHTISLETKLGDEEGTLMDLLADDQESPTDSALKADLKKQISEALKTLDTRESTIIQLLFGLDGDEFTPEEVSEMFEIPVERVKEIKGKALRKLRESAAHLKN